MTRPLTRRRRTATAPPDPAPRRATTRRATIAGLALVLGVAACQSIVVTDTGVESQATMAASPVSVVVGGKNVAAVEIRMRDCHTVRYETTGAPEDDFHLRPVATVEDADGTILFANMRAPGSEDHVAPAGSKVTDGGTDGPHRIVVPVAGATLPLAIGAACTMYPGVGSGGPFGTWSFPTCTAWRRTCLATDPGEGEWSD